MLLKQHQVSQVTQIINKAQFLSVITTKPGTAMEAGSTLSPPLIQSKVEPSFYKYR